MNRWWAAAFLLRRWRAERGIVALLVLLVGITSFLAAAAPRLYNLVADAGLRAEIGAASPPARNIEIVQDMVTPPGEDPDVMAEGLGRTYLGVLDDDVRALIRSSEMVVTSPRFGLQNPPLYPTYVALRVQTGIENAIHVVGGRLPVTTGEALPGAALEFGPPPGEVPDVPPRIEVAISQTTADESGLAVGQVFEAAIDSSDPLLPRALVRPLVARIEVVGIFSIDDPRADLWYADPHLQHVAADFNADTPVLYATALVSPESLPFLVTSNLTFRYQWHHFIDAPALDAGRLDTVLPEFRRLETAFQTSMFGTDADLVRLNSGLDRVLEGYLTRRAASEAVLSIAAIGPLALAAGSIGMLSALLVARRRSALQLVRGRGASSRLILGAQLWEATLLAGAGALAGLLLATLIVPGRQSGLSATLAIGTALVSIAVLVASTWPAIRRPPDPSARDEVAPLRTSSRRLVLELTAVVVALIGAGLLRQRGLTIEGGADEVARFDPFLAAVPMLAGFAAGIVAARLYPLPIRALGWLAARRRDLVPVLGLRSVGRRPAFATLPLLVLMLTAAFGSFALAVTESVDRGQVEASWRAVGADYRIQAPPGADLAGLPFGEIAGVEASAAGFLNPSTAIELPGRIARIQLMALDVAAFQAVAEGSPTAPSWPAELLAAPTAAAGTADEPIPAIISPTMPSGAESVVLGATTRLQVGQRKLSFRVVAIRDDMPGLAAGSRYLVAPLAPVIGAPRGDVAANLLFLRGSPGAAAAISELIERDGPTSTAVASRHAWYDALRGSPLVGAVSDGFRVGFIVAIAYAAMAIVTALTLGSAHRTRDLAFLRTLGLTRGQGMAMTLIEHAAPVLVAVVPGIATGVALAIVLQDSLGLDAFVGPGSTFRVQLELAGLAAVAALLLLVVAGAVALSTWLARRAPVVQALRLGEA
jgi:putative ABC transport system permease protein